MATRSNACSELTRFWLEARLGYLVTESVPVPVKYALSDIDFLAIEPQLKQISLSNGQVLRATDNRRYLRRRAVGREGQR